MSQEITTMQDLKADLISLLKKHKSLIKSIGKRGKGMGAITALRVAVDGDKEKELRIVFQFVGKNWPQTGKSNNANVESL